MKYIDNLLNRITMYRLVLYFLIVLWAVALLFNIIGVMHYDPVAMIVEAGIILAVCWAANAVFAKLLSVHANVESFYITAFILMLIMSPAAPDLAYVSFLALASLAAITSKFILAINRKHVFNPAAFGVALTAFVGIGYASWWIGTAAMLPFVFVGGLLVIRKLIRWDLVLSFLAFAGAAIAVSALMRGSSPLDILQRSVVDSPLIFFAAIMITEPLTTPPTRWLRVLYGAVVGALFAPGTHIAGIYSTPELALLAGNLVSYAVSPKFRLLLTLQGKEEIATDIDDFVFTPDRKLKFRPGQYLEWTLGHRHSDSRGNRRYFTVASSPTEDEIHMGVKFYDKGSSFKLALSSLKPGDTIIASQLAGDFTLPDNNKEKLVLIAGGIGVTPYRSMAKYLADQEEHRDIVMIYSAKTAGEFAYRDVFKKAESVGWRSVYTATDMDGYLTVDRIKEEVPDFMDRMFYISGPRSMVATFQDTLKKLGIPRNRIKTDFFPGFV